MSSDEPCSCELCARIYRRANGPRLLGTRSTALISFIVENDGATIEQLTLATYGARGSDKTERLGTSREDRVRCVALLAALVARGRLKRLRAGKYVLP